MKPLLPSWLRRSARLLALCLLVVGAALPEAHAALPSHNLLEGALTTAGGTPAVDGDYALKVAVYPAAVGGTAAWSEGPTTVKVVGGHFVLALGTSAAIDAPALAGLGEQWIGITVGNEPELPRQQLSSVLFARVAEQALDVACSACVSVQEVKFDGDIDLGAHAIKAASATITGNLTAKVVTAQSFVGDGSKLTGVGSVSGSCSEAGEVVKGIAPDGTLICTSFGGSLPNDSIAATSNGIVSNVFQDVLAAPVKDVKIPDNTGAAAVSEVVVPDLGSARDLVVSVKIANSDLSGVSVVLLPPDDKAKGWTLCDPCGQADEKSLTKSWSTKNPPKSGDIAKWIDANPKGTWTLKVLDTSFCIPQKPGNQALCTLSPPIDGAIADWSLSIETLSTKKIQVKGDLVVTGNVLGGNVVPPGAVMMFNLASCPTGWQEFTAGRGRYPVGLNPGGKLGTTIGTALTDSENRPVGQHDHAITDPGHIHGVPGIYDSSPDGGSGFATDDVGLTINTNSAVTGITIKPAGTVAGTNAPYVQLLMCEKL